MRLFITGAEGFVGKELVSQCKEKGWEVFAVDLTKTFRANYYQTDIRSKDIITLIPEKADAIIHLAGLTRDSDCKDRAYDCFDANVMATLNLIDAAYERKVKQFIFASSEWVYGQFKEGEIKDENSFIDISSLNSEYALSKLISEVNLKQKFQHGFCPVTILRFGIVYGPRKDNWSAVELLFNDVKTKDTVKVGSLRTSRRFIHVKDVASGIIASLGTKGFEIFNLSGDELISLKDIIDMASKILGKNPKITEATPEQASIRNIANDKIKQVLNWHPKFNLELGLKTLIN